MKPNMLFFHAIQKLLAQNISLTSDYLRLKSRPQNTFIVHQFCHWMLILKTYTQTLFSGKKQYYKEFQLDYNLLKPVQYKKMFILTFSFENSENHLAFPHCAKQDFPVCTSMCVITG